MEFFDSHAHYNDEKFDEDREELIKKAKEAGVNKVIVAGYDIDSSKKAIEIAENELELYAACGISPNDIVEDIEFGINCIENVANSSKKVVAIGEIGLDYYWSKDNKELQKAFFKRQIQIANKLNLPIVIHSRDAHIDTINILKEVECHRKGVFHCCQLNQELVREALELGYFISLAGPVTFKNSKNAPEIIKQIPLEKMLIETDSPYLAPEPVRGTRNDPRNVIYIAKKVAQIREMPLSEIAQITYDNAIKLFNIKNIIN